MEQINSLLERYHYCMGLNEIGETVVVDVECSDYYLMQLHYRNPEVEYILFPIIDE